MRRVATLLLLLLLLLVVPLRLLLNSAKSTGALLRCIIGVVNIKEVRAWICAVSVVRDRCGCSWMGVIYTASYTAEEIYSHCRGTVGWSPGHGGQGLGRCGGSHKSQRI